MLKLELTIFELVLTLADGSYSPLRRQYLSEGYNQHHPNFISLPTAEREMLP
jgi:hypothetical protein